MNDSPINIDTNSFDKVVLQSKLPVLVDFWAPWCGPCKLIAPHLEALAKDLAGKAVIAKLNTDDNPEMAGKYQVSGIPTLMIFNNGEMVDRMVGAMPKDIIKEKLMGFIG